MKRIRAEKKLCKFPIGMQVEVKGDMEPSATALSWL